MLLISGTIKNAVQLDMLQGKWEEKKMNNDWRKDDSLTPEQRMVHQFRDDMEKVQENKKMEEISSKIRTGQRLTSEEADYLQKNNPQLYNDYKEIQEEREAYERKLRNCKTKEEVDRLKTNQMNSYAATAKKTFNNPNIPLSEKYRIACKILGKIAGVTEAEAEFKMSAEYKNLESEHDIRRREHAEAEAKEEAAKELGVEETEIPQQEDIPTNEQATETEQKTETVQNPNAEQTPDTKKQTVDIKLPEETKSVICLVAELWDGQRPVGEGAGYIDAAKMINKLEHKDNEV